MSKLSFVALAVLGCLHLDLAAQPQAKETRSAASTISGRVTLKEEPLRGVTVTLQPQRQGVVMLSSEASHGRTDANGLYSISGVAPGRYSISASAAGYISAAGDRAFLGAGRTLNVGENENIENIDIEMKRGGVITGRITDANGKPLVEEQVSLTKLGPDGKPQPFYLPNVDLRTTDDRGVYRIYGLPEGRYLVSAGYSTDDMYRTINNGKTYPTTYYENTTDQAQAKPVEVGEGDEITGIDLELGDANKTFAVSGRVVLAETGQPVPGIQLYLGAVSDDGRRAKSWGGQGERSNDKGEFRLTGVIKGKYAVVGRGEPGDDVYGEPAFFEVSESDVSGVEVRVTQGSTLSGVVVIEGTNDPKVKAKLSNLQLYINTQSDGFNGLGSGAVKVGPDGSFIAKGLPPGKLSLTLVNGPYNSMNELSLLRLERNGSPQPEGIAVNPGENIANVRVVLAQSILMVRGEVKVVNGALPKNIQLYASMHLLGEQNLGRIGRIGEVDQVGRFIVENLLPGEYELQLFSRSSGPVDPRLSQAISRTRERVVVASDNQPSLTLTVDLTQPEGNQ